MEDSFHARLATRADHDRLNELAGASGFDLALETELAKPWASLWVVEPPGGPVASYALVWQLGDECELVHVATAPELRRRGAARALLVALLKDARRRGSRAVYLEVRRSNHAALGLYEAFGFEQTGVRRGYYSDGEDAVQMRHSLES
jgi:ribosomal-protein-alanine N-acetyltransferase